MGTELKRKLAAILVADVVGYSRLIADDEEATLRRLEVFRSVWQDCVTKTGGRIFNTAGDAVLAEFQSAVEAVRCALEFQVQAKTQNDGLVPKRQMHFRIGITIGDVVERRGDLLGDGVNIAARLQTLSGPGGICVSSWVREAVANKLNVKFADLGDQTVKNIPTPIRAYLAGPGDGPPLITPSGVVVQSKQDWLGRSVSSWRSMGLVLVVAGAGVTGLWLMLSQFRPTEPPKADPSQRQELSPIVAPPKKERVAGLPGTKTQQGEPGTGPGSSTVVRPKTGTPPEAPRQTGTPKTAQPPEPPEAPRTGKDEPRIAILPPQQDDPPKTRIEDKPVESPPARIETPPPKVEPPRQEVRPPSKDDGVRLGRLTEAVERDLRPGDRFKECETCPVMVVIPRGDFLMGSSAGQPGHEADEAPAHKVTIATRLAVARNAVTVAEFETFVAVTGYRPGPGCRVFEGGRWVDRAELSFRDPGFPQTSSHPVVCVNWNDAKAYTDWMTARMGGEYRLPTEAEREYATRAGSTTAFWWGNEIAPAKAGYDWSHVFGGSERAAARRGTHPVDAFEPNPWGLYQMHGNVSEWVEDCWNDSYRGAPSDGSAWQSGDCRRRVLRGGSWGYTPKDLRASYREGATLAYRNFNFGFRVVRVLRGGR